MHGVHLVIFCAERYRDVFLKHCVYCVDRHVQDPILSRTIVSPDVFTYPDFSVIPDEALWPDIGCDKIQDFFWRNQWLRQQILKLSVDQILTGDILIVDADLFFLQPLTLVQDHKYNIYHGVIEHNKPFSKIIELVLGESKDTEHSFISDFMIFNSDILSEMKYNIEIKNQKPWIESLYWAMLDPNLDVPSEHVLQSLSEFELYGTYLMSRHRDRINLTFTPPPNFHTQIPLSFDPYDREPNFLQELHRRSKNRFQCVQYYNEHTLWRDFWTRVRDQSWPDCDSPLDFQFLPQHIQQECIETHRVKEYFRWIPTIVSAYDSMDPSPKSKRTLT